ncbi:threonine/serine dehydratase [Roseovarius sp. MMSF_3281]|uniref:threonine ammonia-lyase n=1 Tax=Roseovarius sp. MMSF_3281 TaxID=3046694 RepID=UPI00273E758B|nr:threonine/serine dehydratase [Roseovarius sp. MMSF_3281]
MKLDTNLHASAMTPPAFADVLGAAQRIQGIALRTPLVECHALNERLGGRVFLKLESLQRTGAFKFRGAVNRLSRLAEDGVESVIAYSTGNHGQAIATAARLFGQQATIVMPQDAPQSKIARAKAAGATIRFYDRSTESREGIAAEIREQQGGVIVPPGDDPAIIAGQGTVALEAVQDLQRLGLTPDVLLTPCGGGGLSAGCAIVLNAISAQTELYAVEPAQFNDTERSLAADARLEIADRNARSICDALLAPIPAELPFSVNRHHLKGVLTVTDAEVMRAMRFGLEDAKVLIEPGGAVALSAALEKRISLEGRTAIIVCSGGNVDTDLIARLLEQEG